MASVLHVELEVRSGAEDALVDTYRSVFQPAIRAQAGFRWVRLLRPVDAPAYCLVIEFTEETLRQRWVASELHQEVWPRIEAHCSATSSLLYTEVEQ